MSDPNPAMEYVLDRGHVIAPARRPEYGLQQRFWNRLLGRIGWKVVGTWPTPSKFVMIVAPHTSNWDMPLGLLAGFASGILHRWPYGFMMKDDRFKKPFGSFMRKLGGLPIDRRNPNDVVDQMRAAFAQRESFILAIAPEGARRKTEYWKSGFYFIALAAAVPVVPISFDYGRKEIGLGEAIHMTGDRDKDIGVLREFFRDVTPRYPNRFGFVRFRD